MVVESVNPPGINLIMKNIMMKMKQILITLLLLLGAANLSAQSSWSTTNEDQYNSEIRQELNLDYTLPDYSIHKVDPKVMGPAWQPSFRNSVPNTSRVATSVCYLRYRATR